MMLLSNSEMLSEFYRSVKHIRYQLVKVQICRLEKEKSGLQREIDDLQAGGDADSKHRQNAERLAKQLEVKNS